MKITINTSVLQELVAKAIKGASCNKMIPLTSLIAIELKDGTLTLTTTDATNYLYVRKDKVVGDDFYAVVGVDVFAKLVARLTCESVTLDLQPDSLKVVGNGTYSIELPLDENGEPVRYPNPLHKVVFDPANTIKTHLSTINVILNTAKASLCITNELPCYTGYYMADKIVTTDTFKICGIDIKMFDKPILLNADAVSLLNLFSEEDIKVDVSGDIVVFSDSSCTVYTKAMKEVDDFQIDAINGLLEQSFASSCSVSKQALLQLLDRLSLFVSAYDKNGIYLTFTSNGLQIESKKANSVEVIPYLTSENFKSFSCCIDIEMFASQVKASLGDSVCIHYGEDNAIKLKDGNITQIIALLDDDR